MTWKTILARTLAVGALMLLPARSWGQANCNGLVQLTGDAGAGINFAVPGTVIRVTIGIGTGPIQGGTTMTVQRLRFDQSCDIDSPLLLTCTPEAPVNVVYNGDATITDTCAAVSFTSNSLGGNPPNELVFTPNIPLVIPANSFPFCSVSFDITVTGPSTDSTPNFIEEVAGYLGTDATCNNGLTSGGFQSASIPLCPSCVGNECNSSACNQTTGQCALTPLPGTPPCTDSDGNACTDALCVAGVCDQNQNPVVCTPDGNECTTDPACDPATGACNHPPVDDDTPCTDTDNNACTDALCEGGVCDQNQNPVVCVPDTNECTGPPVCDPATGICHDPNLDNGTPCTDTDGQTCTSACCQEGVCMQACESNCAGFTRTVGFWKNHPALTQQVITDAGGAITVCGEVLTNVAVDDASSALEAMCGPASTNFEFQCCRQLTAATLNGAAGGAVFGNLATCNAVCGDPTSTKAAVTACVNQADDFNQSGDNLALPFPPGRARSGPCDDAGDTKCLIIQPQEAKCAVQ